jgi:large subunit ribosomal protein L22
MDQLEQHENEACARGRFVRIAPRKVRVVANLIRTKPVAEALEILAFTNKRGAKVLRHLLDSAVANAQARKLSDVDQLVVKRILVDQGPAYRRFRPRAMGRASRVNKFTSHIHIFVGDAAQ